MDLVTLALAKSYTDKEIQKAEMGDIQLDTELGKSGYAADSKAIKEYVDNAISQTSTWTLLHENSYQKVYLADYSNTPIDIEKGKSLASPTSTSYDALTAFIVACYEFCRGNRSTNYNYQAERIAQNGAILVSEGVLTGSLKISVSASANRNEYRNLSLIRAAKEGKKCWLITDNTDGSGSRVAAIFEDGTIGANTCPLTDSTLSAEGVPADAKVVGEILAAKQPLGNYALKEEIPIKNSQLENDSGFLTEAPVTSVNGQKGDIVLSAEDFNAEVSGTSAALLSTHNTSTEAHNDIRLEIKDLADRLTAFFDSDDATLDQLSEIVEYITSNKTLIESITTSKVSVADIVDNLTTNVGNKPLSAAQGVVLKGLIDGLTTSLSNYQPKGDYALKSDIQSLGKLAKKDIVEKKDLTEDVQNSLSKADSALQDYTETDPTVPAWAKETKKPKYVASEVEAVAYTVQDLTEEQKNQARTNIGAIDQKILEMALAQKTLVQFITWEEDD